MIDALAAAILTLAGGYLIGLGLAALFAPMRVATFLLAFAQSVKAHWLEMLTRILVGAALLMKSPAMAFPNIFLWFGVLLLGTSVLLLLLPWRWHRRFAAHAVPRALRHLPVVAMVSAMAGAFLLTSLWRNELG